MQVKGLSGVRSVWAYDDHTVAIRTDGSVWTWGYNKYGQLGDGTSTDRNVPVRVKGVNGVGWFDVGGSGAPPVVQSTQMAQIVLSPSLSASPYGDVLSVDSKGVLWRAAGSATGKLGKKVKLGTGWGNKTLYAPGDWNRDGKND